MCIIFVWYDIYNNRIYYFNKCLKNLFKVNRHAKAYIYNLIYQIILLNN